jgi:hypothetical protein
MNFREATRRIMHNVMNLKPISILCSALLGLAILTPQAQARDHRHDDNDRRDRYEHRDRRDDSDRDRHYSYDRDCDRNDRDYDRCDDDRRDDRDRPHFSRREQIFSLIFGR